MYDLTRYSCMNENHALLANAAIQPPELDAMVALACDAGATGAKLSGTGNGGIIIACTPDKVAQDSVARALEHDGYWTCKAVIGV